MRTRRADERSGGIAPERPPDDVYGGGVRSVRGREPGAGGAGKRHHPAAGELVGHEQHRCAADCRRGAAGAAGGGLGALAVRRAAPRPGRAAGKEGAGSPPGIDRPGQHRGRSAEGDRLAPRDAAAVLVVLHAAAVRDGGEEATRRAAGGGQASACRGDRRCLRPARIPRPGGGDLCPASSGPGRARRHSRLHGDAGLGVGGQRAGLPERGSADPVHPGALQRAAASAGTARSGGDGARLGRRAPAGPGGGAAGRGRQQGEFR